MRILGIESSCDETAAAVVEDGERVLSSVVASQMSTHGKYGGVVPELASREHLRAIVPVARSPRTRRRPLAQLDAIAATVGPGLVGSLLVGLTYAKSLSLRLRRTPDRRQPYRGTHPRRHPGVEARRPPRRVPRPRPGRQRRPHPPLRSRRRASAIACSARPATMPPAKPSTKSPSSSASAIPAARSSTGSRPTATPAAVQFTLAKMKGNALDFSFSGLKTAVLRWVESHDMTAEIAARRELVRANPIAYQRRVARRHPPTHARLIGFVPTNCNHGTPHPSRGRRRNLRRANPDHLRRSRLQQRPRAGPPQSRNFPTPSYSQARASPPTTPP